MIRNEAITKNSEKKVKIGIPGLDSILDGGLPEGRLYLLAGDPGAGKTTLALQFLLEGRRLGERCLFVTLSETEAELRSIADSHGFDLEGIEILDLQAASDPLRFDAQYTILHPSEVELGETTRIILERVDGLAPDRVCFDSLSEVRLLARDSLRFRREILALKNALADRHCTTLFIDYRSHNSEFQIESLVHGVIELAQQYVEFGGERRHLTVRKVRGSPFRGGQHDYVIRRGGLEVFPRLVAAESRADYEPAVYESGIGRLDTLLGGGVGTGTSTMLLGPSGVGKSTLAAAWAIAAARRGERALVYLFDESPATWRSRLQSLGLVPDEYLRTGLIHLVEIDPAEMSPNQFTNRVQEQILLGGTSVVIIDTINGYLNAMPDVRHLPLHLRELLHLLNHHQLVTLLVMTQHGILGQDVRSPVDLSYLADSVILLRYFEAKGEVRKAVSVLKKRHGEHERAIRELRFTKGRGIEVGEQLGHLQGVLAGSLVFTGDHLPSFQERDGAAVNA